MTRILIATDSFKGTFSSLEAGHRIADVLEACVPNCRTRLMAMADGGDGTAEALVATFGGHKVDWQATGPAGTLVNASYAILADKTAVVEMAAACGARLAPEGLSPSKATTRGVGELLLDAARLGCTRILLGVGSSATTDGGCGAAQACGVRFLNRYVEPFEPTGATLGSLESVDVSGLDPLLKDVELRVLCAVDNPLCGMMGTSTSFSPTKGALPSVVETLDRNLAHLACVVRRDLGVDMLSLPRGGAGGGMAAGMAAFFGAKPECGADALLDMFDFDTKLAEADVVVTGEGCFDAQSLRGKVVTSVARRCKAAGKPLVAFVGTMDDALVEVGHSLGVTTFAVINPSNRPLEDLVYHPRMRMSRLAREVGEVLAAGGELPGVVGPLPDPDV